MASKYAVSMNRSRSIIVTIRTVICRRGTADFWYSRYTGSQDLRTTYLQGDFVQSAKRIPCDSSVAPSGTYVQYCTILYRASLTRAYRYYIHTCIPVLYTYMRGTRARATHAYRTTNTGIATRRLISQRAVPKRVLVGGDRPRAGATLAGDPDPHYTHYTHYTHYIHIGCEAGRFLAACLFWPRFATLARAGLYRAGELGAVTALLGAAK